MAWFRKGRKRGNTGHGLVHKVGGGGEVIQDTAWFRRAGVVIQDMAWFRRRRGVIQDMA